MDPTPKPDPPQPPAAPPEQPGTTVTPATRGDVSTGPFVNPSPGEGVPDNAVSPTLPVPRKDPDAPAHTAPDR